MYLSITRIRATALCSRQLMQQKALEPVSSLVHSSFTHHVKKLGERKS
jgi:hypothetical protein